MNAKNNLILHIKYICQLLKFSHGNNYQLPKKILKFNLFKAILSTSKKQWLDTHSKLL
jgi:hypothetical protein